MEVQLIFYWILFLSRSTNDLERREFINKLFKKFNSSS
jgi:hypothetical protein